MTASAYSAGLFIDMAVNIAGRLPSTLAGMAAGVIDRDRARAISNATLHLPDDLAAEADKVLDEAGRELGPAEAIAGKASIDAEAVRLRNAGLPGTLAQIRAVILLDRIHQRSPWDRLAPLPEPAPEPDAYDDYY